MACQAVWALPARAETPFRSNLFGPSTSPPLAIFPAFNHTPTNGLSGASQAESFTGGISGYAGGFGGPTLPITGGFAGFTGGYGRPSMPFPGGQFGFYGGPSKPFTGGFAGYNGGPSKPFTGGFAGLTGGTGGPRPGARPRTPPTYRNFGRPKPMPIVPRSADPSAGVRQAARTDLAILDDGRGVDRLPLPLWQRRPRGIEP